VPTSAELTLPETSALIDDLNPALAIFGDGIARPTALPCPALGSKEILELQGHGRASYLMGNPDRPAYIIYTSGTSGRARGVVHAHRVIWARRMMWQSWYDLKADDRLMHTGAFNWTYTLGTGLMDPWAVGATALIPAPGLARATLLRLMGDARASILATSPGILRQMLKSGAKPELPALRHTLCAGEKLPQALKSAWQRASGRRVFEGLGMTEISTYISDRSGNNLPDGATGWPQAGRRVAVLSFETRRPAPLNTPGVLAVSRRDPGMMLGYLNAPEETKTKYHGEWFLTGDVVSMDAHGAITYLGRSDDMMNAGGFRVSPLEVEAVLNSHPEIADSAAVAVEIKPDTFVIAAFYLSELELPEAELAEFCAPRLARYKTPRLFRRLETLPKGANNKLKRAALRADFKGTT
jgi:acyl-coenzyme A synthetase/AMP-(fatty) acid ligase